MEPQNNIGQTKLDHFHRETSCFIDERIIHIVVVVVFIAVVAVAVAVAVVVVNVLSI